MKVFNLSCAQSHGFEGWFSSEGDYEDQLQRGLMSCPMCGDASIRRLPSAPRLNLSGARAPAVERPSAEGEKSDPSSPPSQDTGTTPADHTAPSSSPGDAMTARATDLQAAWMQTVRRLMANTEDVGERFAEEARRIHYGEKPDRGIRGQATAEEREALRDEGIETMAIPVPAALKGPLQ